MERFPCSWVGRLTVGKTTVLPKSICWCSAVLVKTLTGLFGRNWQADSKIHVEIEKAYNGKNNFEKEQQSWGANATWHQFCITLEHSFVGTVWMTQKAASMHNWWLAASSRQCTCSCITSHAEYFGKTSNHPGDSAPYSPDLAPCDFWLFLKLKSPS